MERVCDSGGGGGGGGGGGSMANVPESPVLGTKAHELGVGVAVMVRSFGGCVACVLCGGQV